MAKKKRGTLPAPLCKVILPCVQVIHDHFTNLYSIIGIFNDYIVYQFPAEIGPYSLFLQLTNGHGHYEIAVEIQDLQSGKVIAKERISDVELDDTLNTATLILTIPKFQVTGPGRYDVLVLAGHQEIGKQTITITEHEKEGGDAEDQEEAE